MEEENNAHEVFQDRTATQNPATANTEEPRDENVGEQVSDVSSAKSSSKNDDSVLKQDHDHETSTAFATCDTEKVTENNDSEKKSIESPEAPKVVFKVPTLSKVKTKPKEGTRPTTDNRDRQSASGVEGPDSKSTKKTQSAEQQKIHKGPVPYQEPAWSGSCEQQYKLEIIKNGAIIDNIDLRTKPFHVFGRLQSCDVSLEHPSLSRYHAVVQYSAEASDKREVGWYLYDLDSTHGTWLNKYKVKPRVYHRIRVGHVIKFGGSTRLFIVQV